MQYKLAHVALRTALLYAIVAGLYILISGKVLAALVSDPALLSKFETYKGWAFVIITAFLLYFTLRSQLLLWEQESEARKQAEDKLRESESNLSSIINSAMDAVITLDENHKIILFNKAAEKMFQYSADEMMGKRFDTLIPEKFRSPHTAHMRIFAESGFTKRTMQEQNTIYGLRADGTEIPLEASISMTMVGKRKLFTIIHRDITERLKAEKTVQEKLELHSQLSKIAAASPGLICSFRLRPDGSTSFPYASDAIEDIYGLNPKDVAEDSSQIFNIINADDAIHVRETIAESARTMSLWHNEFRINHPRKGVRWLEGRLMPVKEADGSILWHGLIQDITERKHLEEELKRSKSFLNNTLENAPVSIFIKDAEDDFRITYWNHTSEEMFGIDKDQIIGFTDFDLFPKEQADFYRLSDKSVIESGQLLDIPEEEGTSKTRGTIYLRTKKVPIFNDEGKATHLLGIADDITEHKLAEEALRKEQERFAKVAASAPGVVYAFRLAPDGSVSMPYASQAITDFFDVLPEEITENVMPIFERLPSFDAERAFKSITESARTMTPWRGELHWIHPTKGEMWIEGNSVPTQEPDGSVLWYGFLIDVTERKRAEKELRENEERYRSLVTATSQIVWTADAEGTITNINNIEGIFGKDYEGKDQDWVATIHPDDRTRVVQQWKESLQSQTTFEFEYRQIDVKGNYRYWITRGVPIFDEEGKVREWIGTASDITERKRAQEEVQRFISLSPTVVYALKLEGELFRHKWTSENLFVLTGYQTDETNEPDWWSSNIHPEDREKVFASHSSPYEIDHQIIEFRFRKKDGSYIWVRDEKRLLRDANGKPTEIVGAWSDITERVQLEEKFRQAQKMEAIGQLAGGVAHDFNNLLTVISGYSEILLSTMNPDDKKRKYVSDIHQAGERAASLTRQLLAFSRKQVLEPQILNLNDVIKNTEKMLRRLIGEDIILTTLLDASISNIKVDPGQIEQVIMNLAVNARDAMPKGGRLTIETSNVVLDKNHWKYDFEFVEGNYVMLTVTDTGCGMTQETKERIFEPFFTTKEQGKGTGLGLATVFGIIRQSDGHISVYSEVGIGSTFKLYFPAIEENAITRESDIDGKYTMNGDETILLVEDETSVRDMAKITLESYGYKVLAANSGHKAINIVENYADKIHLIVTDVVMPAMSGRELTENLRHHYKDLKILFMSGYTDDAVVRHGIIEKEHAFLQKPFSPIALVKKVRELLDNKNKG